MTRLLVHVEGQTEEGFVNEVLAPHLRAVGYATISARLIGRARRRAKRGGITSWTTVKEEIVRHLREDRACIATTMVDFYALPQTGQHAWPGRAAAASGSDAATKAKTVEQALAADVVQAMDRGFMPARFVPFVTMHEIEALLFSDCEAFAGSLLRPDLNRQLRAIRDRFATPEEINDSSDTAPSKRIERLLPAYQKVLHGVQALSAIGIDVIRRECPHFDAWIERLAALPASAGA
jgi:hypothetical protein